MIFKYFYIISYQNWYSNSVRVVLRRGSLHCAADFVLHTSCLLSAPLQA